MKRILLILLLLISSELSFAQAYKWVDEKGVIHFTDDITQVPEKYRPGVERIGLPEEKAVTKAEDKSPPKGKEDAYKDRFGRGEEFWRARADDWRKKLKVAQERLESLRAKYNELTERFNDSRSSVERANLRKERDQIKSEMDQCKNQIEEARVMLEKKIPEEAELAQAKQEWIK
jgi:flagellar motility protein MotE (MotC chaperone)